MKKVVGIMVIIVVIMGAMMMFSAKKEHHENVILVSVEPLANIVRMVAPEGYEVKTIVPQGVHIHDFEPTMHDAMSIKEASCVFYFGNVLDHWGDDLGIDTKALAKGEGDPHVWLDPVAVKEIVKKVVQQMQDSHIVIDNQKVQQTYKELDRLDEELKQLSREKEKKLFVAHDAFYYLSQRYGFHFVSLMKTDEEEPSLGQIVKMVETLKKDGSGVILGDEMLDQKVYETLWRETGAKRVHFSAMELSNDGYVQQMKRNIEGLKIALANKR